MEDEYGNVYVGPDVRDVEEAMADEVEELVTAPVELEAGTTFLGQRDRPQLDLNNLGPMLVGPIAPQQYLTYEQVVRRPLGSGLMFGGTTAGWITNPIYVDPYAPGGIGRTEPMVTEFQVGGRVEFIGPLRGGTSVSIGDQGVVEEIQTNYQGSGLVGVRVRYTTGTYRGLVGYCDRYLTPERDEPCWALGAIRRVDGREVGEVTEAVRVEVDGFGVGDRVRFVYQGRNDSRPGYGAEGVVLGVSAESSNIWVRWEISDTVPGERFEYRRSWTSYPQYQIDTLQRIDLESVAVAPRTLINGDRVVYVGPANEPTHYNNPAYGTQGVVQGVHETRGEWGGTVRWEDANRNSWHYGANETSEWWLASALCHVDDWLDPDFPYRVGMRVNHRNRPGGALTTWLEGTNGLWEGEILEIDREGGRIRVAHESDLRAAGAWWTRTGGDLDIEKMVPKEGQTGVGRREKKMISTCSLQAELEPAEKTALGRWIKGVLDNPMGDNRFPGSLQDKIAVCYQGQLRLLRDERWMESPPYLYLGRADRTGDRVNVPVSHRLAVAMTLMQMVEPTEELKGAARAALGRYLLGEYQELSKGVVVISKKKPEGLAFSADKVAAKIGDEWVLPTTGEPVKVDGGEWTICSM